MNMELLDYNVFDLDDFGDLASSFSDFNDDDFDLGDVEETNSELSSETSLVGSVNSQSKRQRNEGIQQLQRNYKLSRPRIIKSDFRRRFPQILASVFNSADYDFLRCHINTFYDPNVSIVQQDLRSGADLAELNMSQGLMTGHDYLSEFWYRSMNIAPDLVCTIKRSFVKLRSDGTSTINCTFGLAGTEVLSVDGTLPVASTSKVLYVRPLNVVAQPPGADDLDLYVAPPTYASTSNDDNSLSSDDVPPASHMQQALHRYLKASTAVDRRKAEAKAARGKEGPRKRRKRLLYSDFAPQVALEDWLSVETPVSSTVCNVDLNAHTGLYKRHPCSMLDRVCSSRVTASPHSGEKNFVDRPFTVEYSQEGEVMLTAQFEATCFLEVNFNADNKIESLKLNYLGQVQSS